MFDMKEGMEKCQLECDCKTLYAAQEIKQDKERYAAAIEYAKKQAKVRNEVIKESKETEE